MSSLSLQSSSGLPPAPSSASQPSDPRAEGAFGALVGARSCANGDRPASAPPIPPAKATSGAEVADDTSKIPATAASTTLAMVSALDRSAKMLRRPSLAGTPASASVDKNEKSDADAAVATANAAETVMPQAPALAGVPILPIISLAIAGATPGAGASTALTVSGSKPPALAAAESLVPVGTPLASSGKPGTAQLAIIGLTAGVDSDRDPGESKVRDFVRAVIPAGTEAAMLRDIQSTGATSITASTQPDVTGVDRHLDLARGDAWLNDLASDIVATATNGGRLSFGLAPETLGRMNVEIRLSAAGVSVHMTTSTETARDMLTAAQPRIVDEIRAQGVRVAGTEVSTDASGLGGGRAGSSPRQPTGLLIDAALSARPAAPSSSAELVANGRYA